MPGPPAHTQFHSSWAVIRNETFFWISGCLVWSNWYQGKRWGCKGGGITIFSFILLMLNQSWGIFRMEWCCFRDTSIFQLESLINLYLHKETPMRFFEDTQTGEELSLHSPSPSLPLPLISELRGPEAAGYEGRSSLHLPAMKSLKFSYRWWLPKQVSVLPTNSQMMAERHHY